MTDLFGTRLTLIVAERRCAQIISQMKKDSQPPPAPPSTIRPLLNKHTPEPTTCYATVCGILLPLPSYHEVDPTPMFGT